LWAQSRFEGRAEENSVGRKDAILSQTIKIKNTTAITEIIDPKDETMFHAVNLSG